MPTGENRQTPRARRIRSRFVYWLVRPSQTESEGRLNEASPKSFPPLTGRRGCRRLGVIPRLAPPIVIASRVLDQVLEYSDQHADVEVGGFLLGDWCHDSRCDLQFVDITDYVRAWQAEQAFSSWTLTHESWSRLHRQISRDYPDRRVTGWHHTHPGFGIFLSRQDEFIHRNFFGQPWQVALVVDPRRGELGFFQWCGEEIVDTGFVIHSGQDRA
jgi:proteasome lid subunit RPN8/RPN11